MQKLHLNLMRILTRVSRMEKDNHEYGSFGRMDGDLAMARSGVIVDALLLRQQKCIDDTTFAAQNRLHFLLSLIHISEPTRPY